MTRPAQLGIQSIVSLLAISMAAFAIIILMPADPVGIAIRAWNLPATDETVAALRAEWGLDQPFFTRYGQWLANFVCGDWGRSFRTGEPILDELLARLPVSLSMGLAGMTLAVGLAILLGFAGAVKPGGLADRLGRGLSIFVQAVPAFWLGLILLWVLGVQLRWIRPFARDWTAFVLPIALIALHSVGVFSRVYRRDLLQTSISPYFRTALAKGLSRRQALWQHGHASACYALVSTVRSEAGWVIGSTATMEILFGLPGISEFLVQSIASRDQMVLQAYIMIIAIWMLIMNAVAQLTMRWLDPRAS